MIGSFDERVRPEYGLEYLKFGSTEPLAKSGGSANRAMVLDQNELVLLRLGPVCHVSLSGPDIGQSFDPFPQRRTIFDLGVIGGQRFFLTMTDQFLQACRSENLLGGFQQLECQIGVAIRKPCMPLLGQTPVASRPPSRLLSILIAHQAQRRELGKVLLGAGGGDAQSDANVSGGPRSLALQEIQQPVFRGFAHCIDFY